MSLTLVDESVSYRKGEVGESHFSGGVGPCIVVGALYKGTPYTVHSLPGNGFEHKLDLLLKDLGKDVKNRYYLGIYIILGDLQDHKEYERDLLWKSIKERGYWPCVRNISECHDNTTYSLTITQEETTIEEEEIFPE